MAHNAPIVNCGITSNANASFGPPLFYQFQGPLATALNTWMGTTTCGTANPSQSDIDIWAANSNVSHGPLGHHGVYKYKNTSASFYFCGVTNNNPSLALATFMVAKTKPKNSPVPVNCSTQCQVEAVWSDPNAVTKTKEDMAELCINNHQGKNEQER